MIELINLTKKYGKKTAVKNLILRIKRTCDVVSIIKNGEIVAVEDISRLKKVKQNKAVVSLRNEKDTEKFSREDIKLKKLAHSRYEVTYQGDINKLIRALAEIEIEDLELHHAELEEIFMHYYSN
ncbi:MAG: hypothetical protein H0Z40_09615 [Desulfotomaculum sp.]|nr:hypothetical protein [Desulfotomaculum sp.]